MCFVYQTDHYCSYFYTAYNPQDYSRYYGESLLKFCNRILFYILCYVNTAANVLPFFMMRDFILFILLVVTKLLLRTDVIPYTPIL